MIRPLIDTTWSELATAFERAFSDYAVPMQMTAEALERMQRWLMVFTTKGP